MGHAPHDHHDDPNLDRGLAFDLRTMQRRRALQLFAGAGLLAVVGCGSQTATTSSPSTTAGGSTATTAAGSSSGSTTSPGKIPQETAGPYPGDGSNGPNILTQSGVVRRDIRSSIGSSSTVAEGVPLTVKLKLVNSSTSAVLAGAAVYLWHCDREGRYSMYSQGVTNENYLRGVQEADADGQLAFQTIFPAAYSGRWPHIHFEVYPSLAEATTAGNPSATSQLALPAEVCNTVYATDGYSASVRNMAQTSLASDNVFSDGYALELATVTGSVAGGYTALLTVAV